MDMITVATCALNNWALDLKGNKSRLIEAFRSAKLKGASLLVTPELSITGYGCLDHFLELDLYEQCWEVLRDIIDHPECQNILLDLGMPINHRGCYYNCRVLSYNRKILMIRPKLSLANDGNFREMRYFTPWPRQSPPLLEDHILPKLLKDLTGQHAVPFGEALIDTLDTVIGLESCEELFTPNSPNIGMGLRGAEIFLNRLEQSEKAKNSALELRLSSRVLIPIYSSGSHHRLRKLNERVDLMVEATAKSGGVYLYANQQGCDGDRLYYDGCAMIIVNGHLVAQGSQFSMKDIEVITATVDLQDVRSFRFAPARRLQTENAPRYQSLFLQASLNMSEGQLIPLTKPSPSITPRYHEPEEEIALGPACWLWDYLRRSRQAGFFVPLSGGIDSCSTAVIVFSMCREIFKAVEDSNEQVIEDMCRICGENKEWRPETPQDICNRLFATAYMGTKSNSSVETRSRAKDLAKAIGAYHTDLNIDSVVTAITCLFESLFGMPLRYKVYGGTNQENIALQNIQARLRMVIAYLLAQTIPYVRQKPGSLLVLGSGNVDECLRGYLTKYDCSSADLNPIGAISKIDLKRFIAWAKMEFDLPVLADFLSATPTAELEPITKDYVQSDEVDMGMTYEELSVFGRLRKVERLGPWGQWSKLVHLWGDRLSPRAIFQKVEHFNRYYGINRHKMTTMTPAYHAELYSPDDNRFDLRPFLYPTLSWAYEKIDKYIREKFETQDGLDTND